MVEHEYKRSGRLCYRADWPARRARLFDRCAPQDGIEPFDDLVEQFVIHEHVFLIVDNGSAHRCRRSTNRLQSASSDLTPVLASWLHQAKTYFSVAQPKVLQKTPLQFGRHDEIEAPFERRFSRQDLHGLLERVRQPTPKPSARRMTRFVNELGTTITESGDRLCLTRV